MEPLMSNGLHVFWGITLIICVVIVAYTVTIIINKGKSTTKKVDKSKDSKPVEVGTDDNGAVASDVTKRTILGSSKTSLGNSSTDENKSDAKRTKDNKDDEMSIIISLKDKIEYLEQQNLILESSLEKSNIDVEMYLQKIESLEKELSLKNETISNFDSRRMIEEVTTALKEAYNNDKSKFQDDFLSVLERLYRLGDRLDSIDSSVGKIHLIVSSNDVPEGVGSTDEHEDGTVFSGDDDEDDDNKEDLNMPEDEVNRYEENKEAMKESVNVPVESESSIDLNDVAQLNNYMQKEFKTRSDNSKMLVILEKLKNSDLLKEYNQIFSLMLRDIENDNTKLLNDEKVANSVKDRTRSEMEIINLIKDSLYDDSQD